MGTGLSRPQEVRDAPAEPWEGRKETSEEGDHLCGPGTVMVGPAYKAKRQTT